MTVTGGMICLALAANVFVVPALANALTLEPFTREAMNVVGTHSVGYMGALNMTSPITASATCRWCRSGAGLARLPHRMARGIHAAAARNACEFRAVLLSHPTELDGSGGMVLLRCEPGYAPEIPGPRR